MCSSSAVVRLWLVFDGPSGLARVIGVSQKAAKRGRRVAVMAPARVLEQGSIWLLARHEPADVILAVGDRPGPLEARRAKLGPLADQYAIVQVPVVNLEPTSYRAKPRRHMGQEDGLSRPSAEVAGILVDTQLSRR